MPTRKRQATVAVFVAAVLLLNYPLLFLPERLGDGQFPWLLVYLVVVWVSIIICIAVLTSNKQKRV